MSWFSKKNEDNKTVTDISNVDRNINDDSDNYKTIKLKIENMYDDNFLIHCARLEKELLFIAESYELATENDIDIDSEFPELKFRGRIALREYDIRTATSRSLDIGIPYDYEDQNGYRFKNDNIVCYPKSVYDEKRIEYLRFRKRLVPYIYPQE